MDNLTLAIEILTRCEMEKKRLEEYEREYADVEKAGEGFTWEKWNEVYNKYKPIPDQQRHKMCTKVTCRIIYQMIGGKVNE